MNKTKMILLATGGAIGLAVLVMAYFTWSAFSAKTAALEGDEEEGVDGLETVLSRARSLSHKEVYPCPASLTALESNRNVLVEWKTEAAKLARRGDRVFEKTTPAAFKEFLVADAKRLSMMTNVVGHVIIKPDFAFGPFKDYISGGKMPAESELAELQRKWDDVVTVIETLAHCGVAELTDVSFAAAVNGEEDKGQKTKDKGRKGKKKAADPQPSALGPLTYSYVFSFKTKPAAFVRTLNAFVTSERFITVENFSFVRPKDAIVEALGGEEKTSGSAAAPSGRRRRRGGAVEEKKEATEKAQNGVITDPLLDEPISVSLTVNVRDYRSLEDDKVEEEKK